MVVANRGNARFRQKRQVVNSGLVVDVILHATYSATFNEPVLVAGNAYINRGPTLVIAGETVELSYGDTVAYRFGIRTIVNNMSAKSGLELLRILILTRPDTDPLPSNATAIAKTDQSERLGALFGSHPGGINRTLASHEGIPTDTTARTVCDNTPLYQVAGGSRRERKKFVSEDVPCLGVL